MDKRKVLKELQESVSIDEVLLSFNQSDIKNERDKIGFCIGVISNKILDHMFKNYKISNK
jgi:hypothetical protein